MIELYRKTGESEALVVSLSDEGATLERALMGADEISVSFTTSEPLEIRVGDYTRLESDVYTLNREPNLVKNSAVEYRYDLVLESPVYNLMDKLYTSALLEQGRFSLTGKLEDFVDLLLANINRDEFDPGWRKAVDGNGKSLIVETELKNITFDGESCHDVLSRLANEFSVEYVIKGRTIAFFERMETVRDLVFEQGCGKGLYTLQRQNVDTDNTVTRAYVYGSTENLPLRYREGQGVFDRLSPREKGTDEYIPYFEELGEYPKIVEREVYFDDVKPSFTGRVETVGGEFNVVVTCGAIDFDLKTVAVGQEARVNFLTGDLMGLAFKFEYAHANHRLTLIRQENEMALEGTDGKRPFVPDVTRKAMVGDKFTFTGINLPDAYVRTAEALLAEKGRKWMSVHSCLRVKYNLDLDYRYARERGIELSPGDVVKIVVPGMEGEQKLRVTSVKKELKTGKQSCEVSNYLPESWEDTIEAKIQNARSSVELNRGEMLYNINATKEWTNRHFGRLAEKMEDGNAIVWDTDDWQIKTVEKVPDSELWDGHRFDDYLNQAVKTDSNVKFRSVQSSDFASGLNGFGYKVDERGVGELLGLRLREFLEVPEFRFNRVDVVSGELWNSVAFGLIESVDTENCIVTLKLESGEMSGIRVNDICRGLFHNMEGNADGSIIDTCGFSTLPGFATSYFTPVKILDNGKRFKYELKPATIVHPCPSMKFVVYGNFTDRNRGASAFSTKTYKRYLKGVRTWDTGAENIAMQFGNLSDLNINGVDLSGYSAYLNNVYFTGTLQWTPEQFERLKGQDGYSVTLTTYDMVISTGADGNINQELYDIENVFTGSKLVISAEKQVVNTRYKIQTVIQAYKGDKKLNYSETPGTGEYTVIFTSRGCDFVFNNDIITVTAIIEDIAFVEMEVNCEGNVVFEKRFTLVKVHDGASGDWVSHVFKKSDTRPDTPVGTRPIPDGWVDAPDGDGRWWMSRATINGMTGNAGEWSGPVQVTAEDGVDGAYTDFRFSKNGSATVAPGIDKNARYPEGWSDNPPALSGSEFLWMSKAEVDAYNKLKGTWSAPVRISGEKGDQGQRGLQGLQGDNGEQGIPGNPGANGQTSYFHVKYSENGNGSPMTETPSTYIGTCVNFEQNDPSDYTRYQWHRFEGLQGEHGEQGIPGVNGANGETSYLHIKYSNDGGKKFTDDNGERPGDWIGVCTNFEINDPITVGAYTWSKVKGDKGEQGDKGDKGDKGDQGNTGLQGCICRTSEWASGVEYRNDESLTSGTRYLDIVIVTGTNGTFQAYQCKKTHTSSSSTGVSNTTYWQQFSSLPPVYSPLILAQNSVIRFMQGNQLLVQRNDGVVVAGMAGGEMPLWVGGADPDRAPFRVSETGKITGSNVDLSGVISAIEGSIGDFVIKGGKLVTAGEGLTSFCEIAAGKNGRPYIRWVNGKSNVNIGLYGNELGITMENCGLLQYGGFCDFGQVGIGVGLGHTTNRMLVFGRTSVTASNNGIIPCTHPEVIVYGADTQDMTIQSGYMDGQQLTIRNVSTAHRVTIKNCVTGNYWLNEGTSNVFSWNSDQKKWMV